MHRGYFGIGVYQPKTTENIGTLWRSAHNFGADFIFTIGARYKKQPSDTTKAERHIPLYNYIDFEDFRGHLPVAEELVFVEQAEKSKSITAFKHPERAIYLLGAKDSGIPEELLRGFQVIHVDTPMSALLRCRCLDFEIPE
jgi:tRNA(Leu) C34 or U34 (ribose-2'-O)-methylase TrmL